MRLGGVAGVLGLVGAVCVQGAVITTRQDGDLVSPVVDGVIAPNEYGPGNSFAYPGGGTGFGSNQLGRATLYLKSDVTNLFVAFENIAVNSDSNQTIAYFHTRPGGYNTSGGEMTDQTDQGRKNTSILSVSGSETLWFADGLVSNKADFALCFNNRTAGNGGFSACFELRGAGFTHGIVPRLHAGLGTSNLEFRLPRAPLGLAVSGAVDVATFMVSGDGYMGDGGHPRNTTNEIGYGAGQTNIFRNFHRFGVTDLTPGPGLTRVPNGTLKMPATLPAEGTNSYTMVDAFPGVAFSLPMTTATPPGETNRLFVVERAGIIAVITNLASPSRTVFMNITNLINTMSEGGLLALAFHPQYASNGYFYVWYTTSGTFRDRLSRFTVSAGNPNQGNVASELVLFSQADDAGNHNGGDMHFGADGYLYLSLGDEGGANDTFANSQRIDKDFFGGLIRIDVDKLPGNLMPNPHAAIQAPTNYFVPADNPFIGATQFNGSNVSPSAVRTEFYAVGLRNPFRWSFDTVTGRLYLGDVGQDAREEIDLIKKGGNYGWKWREGKIATPGIGSPPAGFTTWNDPLLDYAHGEATNQGYTVTGGRVYRGSLFPELVGKYIFCDFGPIPHPGRVWSMTDDGTNATSFNHLMQESGVVCVGVDPRNGELLFCNLYQNQIKRLAYGSVPTNGLPNTLADTGAFADLQTLTPYPGIVPYDLNVPFWSDGAIKTRWFSVPATNLAIGFDAELPWTFPTGTVWVKHFELQLTNGVPSSARRIETRLLVKNASGPGGYGVTYRWGSSTTNAFLVPANGLAQDDTFVVNNGGVVSTQVWHYPTRAECLQCHQASAGFAIGFNTVQLNRDHDYQGLITNQLRALSACGYFSNPVTNFNLLRKLAPATDTTASVEYRARSYLQANCRQCHFPGGPASPAAWDARIFTPLSAANIVNGALADTMGNASNRVVVPGVLTNSMMHTRISFRGPKQMPPLASSVVDTQGVALIAEWITAALPGYQSFADWQVQHFESATNDDAAAGADPDGDRGVNYQEWLTGSDPLDMDSAWAIDLKVTNGTAEVLYPRLANRGFDVQVSTDLVEGVWQSLDVPQNTPFFSAVPGTGVVPDPASSNQPDSCYRVRVSEP